MRVSPIGPWEAWLATRPECVRKLAAEFPLGTEIEINGVPHWLLGYTENDMLIISPINPGEDYDGACQAREWICAGHVRAAAP